MIDGYKEHDRLLIFILLAIIVFGFFVPLGLMPLFDLDEGAFSEATREMVVSGNYITTYLNGELRFDKPILIYWLQALSVSIFGIHEFAFRLPSAIASLLWLAAICRFTRRYFDRTTAIYAAIFFASSLQITLIGKAAIADALLNLFIALTMFMIYHFYTTRKKHYLYLTFAFMALGALTKGPVAIMVPFVVSLIFFVLKGEFRLWLKTVLNPIGIVIFLAIAAPWYILEYMDQGEKFINGFFFKHNLSRFSETMEAHRGNLFYFVPVLILGIMPNTGVLFVALSKIKSYLKDDLKLYLLIWFAFVFIFFSFSNTKLHHYVIYGYTPLFIFMALMLKDIKRAAVIFVAPAFLLLLFGLLPYILDVITIGDRFTNSIKADIISELGIFYQLSFAVALLLLFALYKTVRWTLPLKYAFTALLFTIMVNFIIAPKVAQMSAVPIKNISLLAKERGIDLYIYEMDAPSYSVYTGRLYKVGTPPKGAYFMTKQTNLPHLKRAYEILYKEKGIVLGRVR
jgi:4-amino-4-deoxy-L-arabinose transferase-like glycosyltransferase